MFVAFWLLLFFLRVDLLLCVCDAFGVCLFVALFVLLCLMCLLCVVVCVVWLFVVAEFCRRCVCVSVCLFVVFVCGVRVCLGGVFAFSIV